MPKFKGKNQTVFVVCRIWVYSSKFCHLWKGNFFCYCLEEGRKIIFHCGLQIRKSQKRFLFACFTTYFHLLRVHTIIFDFFHISWSFNYDRKYSTNSKKGNNIPHSSKILIHFTPDNPHLSPLKPDLFCETRHYIQF